MQERDHSIDTLRGIAIFIMIAANSAAYALEEPHPFWFRIYGSIAAPLFITLSGMMVYGSAIRKKSTFSYFLLRAFLIIAVAALIDLCIWKIIPFTTVDVLYLIGISTPLVYIFRNFDLTTKMILTVFIFVITPVLQYFLGYTGYPTEYDLNGEITTVVDNQTYIINHWLADGWFPLFPWLGFAIFGSILAELRERKIKCLFPGIILVIAGIALWFVVPAEYMTRNGYSELFYPPSIAFILSAVGIVLLMFYVIDHTFSLSLYQPFKALGACSLLMYILHLLAIAFVLDPYVGAQSLKKFLLIYFVLSVLLFGIAFSIKLLKRRMKNIPYPVKFLIGS